MRSPLVKQVCVLGRKRKGRQAKCAVLNKDMRQEVSCLRQVARAQVVIIQVKSQDRRDNVVSDLYHAASSE